MLWLVLLALVIGAGVLLRWWHRREPLDAVASDAPPTARDEVAGLGMRMTRACVTVAAIGLVLTASCFVVARDVESRLNHQRVERPADAALLGVQQLSAAVDQVLSTAGGVVAARRAATPAFVAVLGPDVDSSPTLAGIALVERVRGTDRWSRRSATRRC